MAAGARLGRRGTALRTAVLSATLAELVEHGVNGVTIAAVAARAGVHETSVYRRWRTRDDLIVDALIDFSANEISVPHTGSVRGDLVDLARQVIAYLSLPLGRAVMAIAAFTVEDESIAAGRANLIASRLKAMRVVIDRAIEQGELPAGTDARFALEMLVSPLHMRTFMTGEPMTDGLPEQLADTILDGLRPRA